MIRYELQAPGTDVNVDNAYYAYLQSTADDTYWDLAAGSFVPYEDLVNGKMPLEEDANQPGLWYADIALPGFTGGLRVIPRSALTDRAAGRVVRTYVVGGEALVRIAQPYVLLDTNYGGIDALRLRAPDGQPVSGATIRVFRKVDYEAPGVLPPVGVASTKDDGRWTLAIPVAPATTYIIHFSKEGAFGPDSVEVVVP